MHFIVYLTLFTVFPPNAVRTVLYSCNKSKSPELHTRGYNQQRLKRLQSRGLAPFAGAGQVCGNSLWFLWGWSSSYLSGVGLWLWRLEEWIWQLSHPHRHGRGDDGVFRVHHSVKQSLQVGLGVSPNMDDLLAGRRVVLARIHDSR